MLETLALKLLLDSPKNRIERLDIYLLVAAFFALVRSMMSFVVIHYLLVLLDYGLESESFRKVKESAKIIFLGFVIQPLAQCGAKKLRLLDILVDMYQRKFIFDVGP